MVCPDKSTVDRKADLERLPSPEGQQPSLQPSLELSGPLVTTKVTVDPDTEVNQGESGDKDNIHAALAVALELLGTKMHSVISNKEPKKFDAHVREFIVIGVATLLGTIGGIWAHDNAATMVEFFQDIVSWLGTVAVAMPMTMTMTM